MPEPNIFKNLKPEARPSPNFKPGGYPKGFFQGKIVQKPQKIDVKLEKKLIFFKIFKILLILYLLPLLRLSLKLKIVWWSLAIIGMLDNF